MNELLPPSLSANLSKRLNYVNHARRLADGDWTGTDSDGEEHMEKQEEGEREKNGTTEEEGMEIERRKLPKHYANQVSFDVMMLHKGQFIILSILILASRGCLSSTFTALLFGVVFQHLNKIIPLVILELLNATLMKIKC